jgi:hypothetical protein
VVNPFRRSQWKCCVAGIALVLALGCSKSDSKLAPVEGVVRVGGQPLTHGKVVFQPTAGRGAQGQIQSDGTFTLGTYGDADGALIGEHKVAIVAFEPGGPGQPVPGQPPKTAKPLVPEKYLAVGTSDLTYDVKPGENSPKFDLESP